MSKIVECVHCGWHHFTKTRAEAEAEVADFNKYYYSLPPEKQQDLYGGHPSNIDHYLNCFHCGNPANMKPVTKSLIGSTIQPIVWEKDDK